MGIDRLTLKEHAKERIRTSVPSALLVTLLYLAIVNGISFWLDDPITETGLLLAQGYDPMSVYQYVFAGSNFLINFFFSILISLFSMVLSFGYSLYALRLNRGQEAGFGELFANFHMVGKIILLQIIQTFFIYLWCLLFFFPGVVAAYRYSQSTYILLDHPELSPMECIRRSKEMMYGHKLELFVLQLSFIGWQLLFNIPTAILSNLVLYTVLPANLITSFVIAVVGVVCALWLTPYMECTMAGFYDAVNGEQPPFPGPEEDFNKDSWGGGNWSGGEDPWN